MRNALRIACLLLAGCSTSMVPPGDGGTDGGADAALAHDAAHPSDAFVADDAWSAPPPRLLVPMSTSIVTTQRPTLHFTPSSASIDVELCRDRACSTPSTTLIATAGAGSVRPTTALDPGWWFWRATVHGTTARSATWQFWVGHRDTPVDSRWGSVLDVNGDGFADVAVSAVHARSDRGLVHVYLGSASGPSASPASALEGSMAGGDFGFSVASAGDVNGDGFGDLLVGALAQTSLYLGSPTGIASTPFVTYAVGQFAAGVGDLDLDGYGDLAIGDFLARTVRVFRGGSASLSSTPFWVADSVTGVATAGDVNGDGFADLLVGGPADVGTMSSVGHAQLFLGVSGGLSNTPIIEITGQSPNAELAPNSPSITCAGDLNGDGYTDLAIGAPDDTVSHPTEGTVAIFLGSAGGVASTPALTLRGGASSASFGLAVSAAGDLDGDGADDLLIGAPGLSPSGVLYAGRALVYAGVVGLATGVLSVPALRIDGVVAQDRWGGAVAGLGDTNGDGRSDLAVGADITFASMQSHAVATYLGTSPIATMTESRRWTGETNGDGYGGSIARLSP